jgi:hypothetical protein
MRFLILVSIKLLRKEWLFYEHQTMGTRVLLKAIEREETTMIGRRIVLPSNAKEKPIWPR